MIPIAQYINESISEPVIKLVDYGSEPMLFIPVKETAKAFLLKWRTKLTERQSWVPKKALTTKFSYNSDENKYYSDHSYDVLTEYKLFNVKHWFIAENRIAPLEQQYFFDEWYRKSSAYVHGLDIEIENAKLRAEASEFIRILTNVIPKLRPDYVEIDKRRLYLKSKFGTSVIRKNPLSYNTTEFVIEVKSFTVRVSDAMITLSHPDIGTFRDQRTVSIMLKWLITGRKILNELESVFKDIYKTYDKNYDKRSDKAYQQHYDIHQQLFAMSTFAKNELKSDKLLKQLRA